MDVYRFLEVVAERGRTYLYEKKQKRNNPRKEKGRKTLASINVSLQGYRKSRIRNNHK
jgi:hypothetical protein